jgi:hypothetical protein
LGVIAGSRQGRCRVAIVIGGDPISVGEDYSSGDGSAKQSGAYQRQRRDHAMFKGHGISRRPSMGRRSLAFSSLLGL